MQDEQKKRLLVIFQNINIRTIFLASMITPVIIVKVLGEKTNYFEAVNGVNIIFKSLNSMVTVFVPVVLADIFYFDNLSKKDKNNATLQSLGTEKVGGKVATVLRILGLYTLLMFGNIREWIAEIYNSEYSSSCDFVRKVDWIECTFLIMTIVLILASFYFKPKVSRN